MESSRKTTFLYIGYTGAPKGTDYLLALAEANPTLHFAWMGGGLMPTAQIETLGPCDFNLEESRRLLGEFDFLITTGRSDANPTTILEAVSWGLVPVCTPQSGYCGEPWLVNIPLDDIEAASAILRHVNEMPEVELTERVAAGRQALETHFTWDRFASEVLAVIQGESPQRPIDAVFERRTAENQRRLRELVQKGGGK